MEKGDKDTFHLKHIVADKKRRFKIKDKKMEKNKREIEKKKRKNNQGIERDLLVSYQSPLFMKERLPE